MSVFFFWFFFEALLRYMTGKIRLCFRGFLQCRGLYEAHSPGKTTAYINVMVMWPPDDQGQGTEQQTSRLMLIIKVKKQSDSGGHSGLVVSTIAFHLQVFSHNTFLMCPCVVAWLASVNCLSCLNGYLNVCGVVLWTEAMNLHSIQGVSPSICPERPWIGFRLPVTLCRYKQVISGWTIS